MACKLRFPMTIEGQRQGGILAVTPRQEVTVFKAGDELMEAVCQVAWGTWSIPIW